MSKQNSSGQTGFLLGLLGIAFVVLKLCHVINWSWWWVTLPFWGGIIIVLGILLIVGLIGGIGYMVKQKEEQPAKSKWEQRLEEIREQQVKVRERNAKSN